MIDLLARTAVFEPKVSSSLLEKSIHGIFLTQKAKSGRASAPRRSCILHSRIVAFLHFSNT
jgi:hypothetical protein